MQGVGMDLNEKQMVKVKEIVASVNLGGDVGSAVTLAETTPSIKTIKAARKALLGEARKYDKALAKYGIDLVAEEARAIVARVGI
jgi:hypothetical protein